ncbi:cytochrome P450 [Trametes versicolor FP-101664 SS1]|uniref:cytochrome P450 n=1 Tax=Trametes versicolor (strain FP-101664) TaxID=717944 RepID=UPI0004621D76|nr:cytochrome P450 [Trametes versicolor FP-101664 SS1]EIW55368.1 cytochrome P450 [Trametes versicolor FP-101664 SS1]
MLLLTAIVLAGSLLCHAAYRIFKKRSRQQPLQNIPGPPSESWLTGVVFKLNGPFSIAYREHVLTAYGRVIKLPALFGDIHLAVSDPLALTTMFGRYRDEFDVSEGATEAFNTVFGPSVVATRDSEHSKHRKLLNPVFSPRVLRETVPLFHQVAQELVNNLLSTVGNNFVEVELSETISRFSLEAVGRAALGYSFGPLAGHGTDYSRALKMFGAAFAQLVVWRPLLPWLKRTFPSWLLRFTVAVLPWKALRRMRTVSDEIRGMASHVLQRKIALLRLGDDAIVREVAEGKDLMSVLLRQNMQSHASGTESLSEDGLIGQMSALLLAATDTTSASIVRAVHLLSERPRVQEKLRREILDASTPTGRGVSDLDYDALAGLHYLDAVIRETLRLYPAFYMTHKVSTKDAILPLSAPIEGVDGRSIHELHVPAGTVVWSNIFGANRDPAIWGPDAAEWKPERWLSPLPGTVADAHVPSVFANLSTFSAGPRSCIGYNLALAEMRVALAHMSLAFDFAPSERAIVWKFGGVYIPSVQGSNVTHPEFLGGI